MIVLLIVAIIAAASAPMISKKMMRQTGTGDSPWLFTGTGNSVAFNRNGNPDDTVFIGTNAINFNPGQGNHNNSYFAQADEVTNSPLVIRTNPDINGRFINGNSHAIAFADRNNQIMGYLGMTQNTTFFSNIIPEDDLNDGDSGATIVGSNITIHDEQNLNNPNVPKTRKTMVGYNINYKTDERRNINDRNHDILYGSNLNISAKNTNFPVGYNIGTDDYASIIIGNDISTVPPPFQQEHSIFRTVIIGNALNNNNNNHVADADDVFDGIAIGTTARLRGGVAPIAIGFQAQANGDNTTAIGRNSSAEANGAIAIGNESRTTQQNSLAIGNQSTTTRTSSIAIGDGAMSTGQFAITIGQHDRNAADNLVPAATGQGSIAIGRNARTGTTNAVGSRADGTIAIGDNAFARGNSSVAIGSNAATNGNFSVALGAYARTNSDNEIVLGTANIPNGGSHTVVVPGTLDVTGTISQGTIQKIQNGIDSDIRLKNVGEKFTSGLDEINKLEFFNYTYKNDKEKKPHVGVMAQNLQKIFPISVSEGSDGYLRIRTDEMFYAALNAIKELDNKIVELKNRVVAYFDRVKKLEAQIDAQQKTIEELKAQNTEFKKRLAKLEKKKGVNNQVNKGVKSSNNMNTESEAE